MNPTLQYQTLDTPIPVHPDDRDLPLSIVNLKLPSGKFASICFPMQGQKTIETMEALLLLWKPTLVYYEDYSI